MPTHPFILFPKAAQPAKRASQHQAVPPPVSLPSPTRQKARLEQKFKDIVTGFDDLQSSATGFEPERVVVFETIADNVKDFAKAAAKVQGLEWVSELDLGKREQDDDFNIPTDPSKKLSARLYAVMTNQEAIKKLLSLWSDWQNAPERGWNRKGYVGFGPFKEVFLHLKDIRLWGPTDRLQHTGFLDAWEENQQFAREHPGIKQSPVRFEIELWCRTDPAARTRAFNQLNAIVRDAGGQCVTQAAIPEISYHGVLAELPAAVVAETIAAIQSEKFTDLLRCEEVMFFRPRAQSLFQLTDPAEETCPPRKQAVISAEAPVVAVFDGLPLANHVLLRDSVTIDDPDDHASQYQPRYQQHGTAMCSLILHGDSSRNEVPLTRPIYVRPILIPGTN
ncbi:MAG: S8 family peptidase, partial [Gemmataceae bacterium]